VKEGLLSALPVIPVTLTATTTTPSVPVAPSNLQAIVASASQINLSWIDNSNNETGFRIEMKPGADGTYREIGTVGANGTGAQITGLSASTTYYFRVRAYNGAGNSGYSNEANATTAAPPTATAILYFITSLTGASSVTFQGQTWITGAEHTFTLSPGTYEMTGTVGANGTVFIAFANGGGLLGTGGVVPGSLRSLSGPFPIVSACNAVWVSTGSASSFRLQFTVTTSTSAACQDGQ